MICFPNAKINLGLYTTEKRPDGFHNIETIFYPIPLCDALEIIDNTEQSEGIEFSSSGISIPGNSEDNLIVKAYHLIAKDYPLPSIKVHLHKHIPIGAGLGGGSADAAFFIKLLNQQFEIGLSWGELHHYAKQLGSDCSFFISNKPAFAKGKGEELETINLSLQNYYFVLVYPHLHVNTASAYQGCIPQKTNIDLEQFVISQPIHAWKNNLKNDFENTLFKTFPEIEIIKNELYQLGAIYASMSGSGSSVFALFEREIDITNRFNNYFIYTQWLN
jgi:4-diphosphocytidyl-2-C-methyl-D-erythritol kinase